MKNLWTLPVFIVFFVMISSCSNLGVVEIKPVSKLEQEQRAELHPKKEKRIQRINPTGIQKLKPIFNPKTELPSSVVNNLHSVYTTTSLRKANGQPWRPLNHFGPFSSGSEFSEIQILIPTSGSSDVHFNNFFTNNSDNLIYSKYFYSTQFPPTANMPNRNQEPGTKPAGTGYRYNDSMMKLNNISYSSKYGGSINLTFNLAENTEFEVKNGSTLWDIGNLRMNVFVQPKTTSMNPTSQGQLSTTYNRRVHIELAPYQVTQYTDTGTGTGSGMEIVPVTQTDLASAMSNLASLTESSIHNKISRFALGFLHNQHQDKLPLTDKVLSLEISDNFVDMVTQARQPYLSLQARILWTISWTDFMANDEQSVIIAATHIYASGASVNIPPTVTQTTNDDTNGPWRTYGMWEAADCDQIIAASFNINVIERDSTSADDVFRPFSHWWQLPNCTTVNAEIVPGSQETKVIENIVRHSDLIIGGEQKGGMGMGYQLLLTYR